MHAAPQDILLTADMADALVSTAGVLPRDMKNVTIPAETAGRLLPALIGYLEGVLGKTIKAAKFVK